MEFKLHAPFQATGDQPEAIAALARGVASAERGVEDRLFHRVRTVARAHQKGGDLERDHGQRPLPRDAGAGMNGKGGRSWASAFCDVAEF